MRDSSTNYYIQNPAATWERILEHTNDQSIDSDFASHTWKIETPPTTKDSDLKFYRFFRVRQTGRNKYSGNQEWCDVLVTSGFELYGHLRQSRRIIEFDCLQSSGIIEALGGERSIAIFSSGLGRGSFSDFINKEEGVHCWTQNQPFSW